MKFPSARLDENRARACSGKAPRPVHARAQAIAAAAMKAVPRPPTGDWAARLGQRSGSWPDRFSDRWPAAAAAAAVDRWKGGDLPFTCLQAAKLKPRLRQSFFF